MAGAAAAAHARARARITPRVRAHPQAVRTMINMARRKTNNLVRGLLRLIMPGHAQ